MTYPVADPAKTPMQSAWLRLGQLRRSFNAIRSIVRLSAIADGGSDDLIDAVQIICESGSETTLAIEAELCRSPGAPTDPAASPRPGFGAGRDTNGGGRREFSVRAAPWTIDRLIHWTRAVDQRLAALPGRDSYGTWRGDLADAGIGIDSADEWPRIRQLLVTHWERLETDYARAWWMRRWYTELLDPRPCGWPGDEA